MGLVAAAARPHAGGMAEVLLFHHICGQTPGFLAFADDLRSEGHTVHTPDLFGGRTFDSIAAGEEYAGKVGFSALLDAGVAEADDLSDDLVYAGFSFGVLPAQKLAQTRPGARGALLCYSCVPVDEFGDRWPAGVPVQVHGMDADPIFVGEGDVEAARELVGQAERGELFLYPGDGHYFADPADPGFDPRAAELLRARVVGFLAGLT
ncbi:dienelactone hydrolase family protein [Nocardioides houyundeii]|uniref:dienelactone hydrolase family protein n=1 Tax=Nocardioides houyundeii TaxID=2045452 RepID=UPI000DF41628|nr:dienelactone hydrolase family protein [Nocardioides houyundeii]